MVRTNVRVLVVDDFEAWRRFVISTLRGTTEFEVVGETADGKDAVRQAQVLSPDIVLMDIGLPGIDGIDAAREILKVRPDTKILFLSQESSDGVVQAALATGGHGYVVKMHAGSELLPALRALLQGERFIGTHTPSPDAG